MASVIAQRTLAAFPGSERKYERPFIAQIWYGGPHGRTFGSRTHSASNEAGTTITLSSASRGISMLMWSVPTTVANIATASFTFWYFCALVEGLAYTWSSTSTRTVYLPPTPPSALSASK